MSVLRPIWLNLAILAALGLQADAVFAQVFNGLQKQAGISRTTQGPHYFTIMGHISRPNCYELPTSSPSLVSFVEYAGDLTRTAGGPIRIVRGGRTVQSAFYSPKSTLRLVPGDIIVVDGKVNQGRVILRGNQNSPDDLTTDVTLALTGIRNYPVVITIPAERATIRWVVRRLGLDAGVVNHVKAITQRQSVQVFPDSRLGTGTVLAFDPSVVDASRLPDDLPVPVKAGRPVPATQQPARPANPIEQPPLVAQQPVTSQKDHQYGAAPGRARVPTIGANSDALSPRPAQRSPQTENLDLTPDEQTFVKQLLTDPSSVPLDEPTPEPSGRAFVSQQPVAAQPSTTSTTGTPGDDSSETTRNSVNSAIIPDTQRQTNQPVDTRDATKISAASPEAPRPYQSEPARPEPLQPFGSSRIAVEDSTAQSEPATEASSPVAINDSQRSGDFSLAAQAATLAADSPAVNPHQAAAQRNDNPSPITSAGDLTLAATPVRAISTKDQSRLLPPPPSNLNWPVISILTVGFFGAMAACFLIYSIAHENPAPRVAQIDTSGRYWLDRMIENDIPIEEEPVDYPHNTQLFGKPAPIQRIDAAHNTVPRPHFSAPGDKSGVVKDTPASPDAPTPDVSGSDSKRIVRVHSGGTSKKQSAAAVPTPHSTEVTARQRENKTASSEITDTAVFGDVGQQPEPAVTSKASPITPAETPRQKASRQFRLDTGHKATVRQPATVQPSPVVVQGVNLLDRILSSVEHEQNVARPKAAPVKRAERLSDERGNS